MKSGGEAPAPLASQSLGGSLGSSQSTGCPSVTAGSSLSLSLGSSWLTSGLEALEGGTSPSPSSSPLAGSTPTRQQPVATKRQLRQEKLMQQREQRQQRWPLAIGAVPSRSPAVDAPVRKRDKAQSANVAAPRQLLSALQHGDTERGESVAEPACLLSLRAVGHATLAAVGQESPGLQADSRARVVNCAARSPPQQKQREQQQLWPRLQYGQNREQSLSQECQQVKLQLEQLVQMQQEDMAYQNQVIQEEQRLHRHNVLVAMRHLRTRQQQLLMLSQLSQMRPHRTTEAMTVEEQPGLGAFAEQTFPALQQWSPGEPFAVRPPPGLEGFSTFTFTPWALENPLNALQARMPAFFVAPNFGALFL
ncbi:unnamed protein product [Polarella glacialis]|uniref:Uncharacterized protein n=1 Tax=Polarella glacialis TaxID=89957 RepID=A0A813FAG1_POLGL|nr:unnamed protein product [Polarella glacialis]